MKPRPVNRDRRAAAVPFQVQQWVVEHAVLRACLAKVDWSRQLMASQDEDEGDTVADESRRREIHHRCHRILIFVACFLPDWHM